MVVDLAGCLVCCSVGPLAAQRVGSTAYPMAALKEQQKVEKLERHSAEQTAASTVSTMVESTARRWVVPKAQQKVGLWAGMKVLPMAVTRVMMMAGRWAARSVYRWAEYLAEQRDAQWAEKKAVTRAMSLVDWSVEKRAGHWAVCSANLKVAMSATHWAVRTAASTAVQRDTHLAARWAESTAMTMAGSTDARWAALKEPSWVVPSENTTAGWLAALTAFQMAVTTDTQKAGCWADSTAVWKAVHWAAWWARHLVVMWAAHLAD